MKKKKQFFAILLGIAFGTQGLVAEITESEKKLLSDWSSDYAAMVHAVYSDSAEAARLLQGALRQLVANPSDEKLVAAREAWLLAREPYGQSEVFRFYDGPIDNEEGPEGLLNAWPLDESYIDYVQGQALPGIIANREGYPTLTKELLLSLNEKEGETNVSCGYHAIEFLLWGQDLSAKSAGQRSFTDYVLEKNAEADRRGQYLLLTGELLIEHLEGLVAAWNPAAEGNYRAQFLAESPEEQLRRALQGLGMLSGFELSGERMMTAYDTQEQEEEHSCFSDNTHRDIILNQQGIANVLTGKYTRLDGSVLEATPLLDVIALRDAELAAQLRTRAEESLKLTEAIPVPFDQAILGEDTAPGRQAILAAIMALQKQAKEIAQAAARFDLRISITE